MNPLDSAIIGFLNPLVQQAPLFDKVVVLISDNGLVKGGVLIAAFWWGWFRDDGRHREILLTTLGACFAAMVTARSLALALPMRLRPLHEESLELLLPLGMPASKLDGWSSFPSDHAALFFTLAAGLCFVSRRVGIAALVYAGVAVCLPRIYLSLHYPSDILGGAVIGIAAAVSAHHSRLRPLVVRPLLQLAEGQAAWFYPALFLVTYQIADMFDTSRAVAKMGITVLKAALGMPI